MGARHSKSTARLTTASRFTALTDLEEEEPLGKVDRRQKEWVPVRTRSEQGIANGECKGLKVKAGSEIKGERRSKDEEGLMVQSRLALREKEEHVGQGVMQVIMSSVEESGNGFMRQSRMKEQAQILGEKGPGLPRSANGEGGSTHVRR